jgi:hypothetical protein
LGPFQFNICSYKQEGKKFRLVLFVSDSEKTIAFTVSPPFLIRAKKPIIRPGLKRKRDEEEEEIETRPVISTKLPPFAGNQLAPYPGNQMSPHQLHYQQPQTHHLQLSSFVNQKNSLDLESDLDKLIEDSWEVIVNPVEDCFSMYSMMSLDDKKSFLQSIIANGSLAEKELLISKLIKPSHVKREENSQSGVEKYFHDFSDGNQYYQ